MFVIQENIFNQVDIQKKMYIHLLSRCTSRKSHSHSFVVFPFTKDLFSSTWVIVNCWDGAPEKAVWFGRDGCPLASLGTRTPLQFYLTLFYLKLVSFLISLEVFTPSVSKCCCECTHSYFMVIILVQGLGH